MKSYEKCLWGMFRSRYMNSQESCRMIERNITITAFPLCCTNKLLKKTFQYNMKIKQISLFKNRLVHVIIRSLIFCLISKVTVNCLPTPEIQRYLKFLFFTMTNIVLHFYAFILFLIFPFYQLSQDDQLFHFPTNVFPRLIYLKIALLEMYLWEANFLDVRAHFELALKCPKYSYRITKAIQ